MPTHQERTQATRRALLDAGRKLFAEHGYGSVAVGEIAQAAGVTTGAIYHQFGSKEGLFVAVYDELVQATWARILAAREAGSQQANDQQASDQQANDQQASEQQGSNQQGSNQPGLVSDCEAFLDACADPAYFRITADGPAVLGWDYLVAQTSQLIGQALTDARDRGEILDVPIEPLSRMLAAAFKEAGVMIATASDPEAAWNQASVTARHLVGSLLRNKTKPASD